MFRFSRKSSPFGARKALVGATITFCWPRSVDGKTLSLVSLVLGDCKNCLRSHVREIEPATDLLFVDTAPFTLDPSQLSLLRGLNGMVAMHVDRSHLERGAKASRQAKIRG